MTNYREYDVFALSSDPSFRRWVQADEDAHFWQDWLLKNPDRADRVHQAREFLNAIQQQYESSIPPEEINAGVSHIVALANAETTTKPVAILLNSRRLGWKQWAAAAVLLLAIGLGWQVTRAKTGLLGEHTDALATASSPWVYRTNTTTNPLTILLTDGSVVTLEPGGQLRYPRRFTGKQRAVMLTGEAFFEVARQPQQPFVVTTNDFTTTVLGTSFRVRSSSPKHRSFVIVRSGKVLVQLRQKVGETLASSSLRPVLLTRNQQVASPTAPNQPLAKMLVQDVDLVSNEVNREQVFEDVAVAAVFDALEKQYGISIQYDRIALSRCLINTSFNEENLRERLSAVCQAVGATYQITDNAITVSSSGCSP